MYQSLHVTTLTCGHELWAVTEERRSQIRAAEMSLLHRMSGLSLRGRRRSSVIREGSDKRWLEPPGRRFGGVFWAGPTKGDPGEDVGHNYVSQLT